MDLPGAVFASEHEQFTVPFLDLRSCSENALRQHALQGDLVTELPPFLAADALRDGRLAPLLPNHPFPEQEVCLLYQRQQQPSRVIRA